MVKQLVCRMNTNVFIGVDKIQAAAAVHSKSCSINSLRWNGGFPFWQVCHNDRMRSTWVKMTGLIAVHRVAAWESVGGLVSCGLVL